VVAVWSDAYLKWNQPATNRIFALFVRQFGNYPAVHDVFTKKLPAIMGMPLNKQVEALVGVASPGIIIEWMQKLNVMIVENKETRSFSLELYRILEGLLMFYACMQAEDINKAKVPTDKAFKSDMEFISSWKNVFSTFTNPEKQLLSRKSDDIARELEITKANSPNKTVYSTMLTRLANLISSLR